MPSSDESGDPLAGLRDQRIGDPMRGNTPGRDGSSGPIASEWDCHCEACGLRWRDVFPDTEEDVTCPRCDADDFDAIRVGADHGE